MAQIIDNIVNVSINDAISSVTTADVNTVALIGGATASSPSATLCYSSDDAKTAFGDGSQLHEMAKAFFAQDTQPSVFVGVPLTISGTTTAADITGELETAATVGDFYHVCVVGELADTVVSGLQSWATENKKMFEIQANSNASSLQTKAGELTADRVAIFKHAEGDETKEYLNVAIVASRCGLDSARGTFAHKKVKGITPDAYTVSAYNAAINAGLNIYVKVQGEARVFMGTTCDKSHFIDQKVVDDFVRFNVQARIYQLLGEANEGNGVTYNDAGIGAVAASVINVFVMANETGREYIRDDFEVSYKTLAWLKKNKAEDVRRRNLPLITGTYSRMGAVHTVDRVTLNVTL